jgi:hypothetical protein
MRTCQHIVITILDKYDRLPETKATPASIQGVGVDF